MQKRNILNSPRLLELKKKRQKVVFNKILLSLFALLTIFAGLAYLSRLPSLNISEIEILGNKVTDAEMIKTTVEKAMTGNYLWFFPKTNIFFYSKNNIKKELQNNFKRLKDINLTVKDRKILVVLVSEREAKYTWCGSHLVVELPSEEKCYFMDDAGYIFDEAPYFSGEVYFKFYSVLNGPYFSLSNFTKFISFKETLAGMGLTPVILFVEDNGDAKMFLSKKTRLIGPEIIFKVDADLKTVAENLQAALSTEPLLSNFKNKYSSLEYIDLRYGNKVYFKFR